MSDAYKAPPNSCLLFRQDKEGNEKRPDYAGEIEIEGGGRFFASLWGRKNRNGNTYLALRLTKKTAKADRQPRANQPTNPLAEQTKQTSASPRIPTASEQQARECAVGLNEFNEPRDITF